MARFEELPSSNRDSDSISNSILPDEWFAGSLAMDKSRLNLGKNLFLRSFSIKSLMSSFFDNLKKIYY